MAQMMRCDTLGCLKIDPYQLVDVLRNTFGSLHLPQLFALSIHHVAPRRGDGLDQVSTTASLVSSFLATHPNLEHLDWNWVVGTSHVVLPAGSLPRLSSLTVRGFGVETFYRDMVQNLCLEFPSRIDVILRELHAVWPSARRQVQRLRLRLLGYHHGVLESLSHFRSLQALELEVLVEGRAQVTL